MDALVSLERKRKESCRISEEEGRDLGGSLLWILSLSQTTKRGVQGGEEVRLLSGAEAASGRRLRDSNPTGASTGADGEAAGEETGSKCPPEEPLRRERGGR